MGYVPPHHWSIRTREDDVMGITAVQEIISAFKVDWIMLTIVGFYFGGGAFEGIKGKK